MNADNLRGFVLGYGEKNDDFAYPIRWLVCRYSIRRKPRHNCFADFVSYLRCSLDFSHSNSHSDMCHKQLLPRMATKAVSLRRNLNRPT